MTNRPDLPGMERCFQPRQWFSHRFDGLEGNRLMWVYKPLDGGKWVVGFYQPDGTWMADGEFDTRDQAAARVNYLNGGSKDT